MYITRIVLFIGLLVTMVGCGSDPDSPEQQVRDLIARAEAAAEDRDIGALKQFVSDDYRDKRGLDRRRVVAVAHAYLLSHQALHLFTVVKSVDIRQPDRAEVVAVVAMAGRPVDDAEQLRQMRADLTRFELTFRAIGDGEWELISATWRRADVADFL